MRAPGNREALEMVLLTLREMAKGGMHDQLGGGFHRYSVDERWFVPHFEKMLYDQAQLAIAYLEAFQITGDAQYAETARGIFDYVLRDMTAPEGGFYSAEDADSAMDPAEPNVKGEGAFYIWTADEIRHLVPQPEADWFCYRYGVAEGGNVANDPHEEFANHNILYRSVSLADTATEFRQPRGSGGGGTGEGPPHPAGSPRPAPPPAPGRQDSYLLERPDDFRLRLGRRGAGRGTLRRRGAPGGGVHCSVACTIPERACCCAATARAMPPSPASWTITPCSPRRSSISTKRSSISATWNCAVRLTEKQRELFEDPEHGAFFSTAAGDAELVMRVKEDYDGAEPSGNSVALSTCCAWPSSPTAPISASRPSACWPPSRPRLSVAPVALPQMLAACEFHLAEPRQIILAGPRGRADTKALVRALHARFLPHRIVLLLDSPATRQALARWLPEIESMDEIAGRAAAYVCRNYACELPVHDVASFAKLLQ